MGVRNSLRRAREAKTFSKLYGHWLDEETPFAKGTLDDPPLNLQETSDSKPSDEYVFPDKQSFQKRESHYIKAEDNNSVWFNIPIRYALLVVGILSMLLITLSVISTILIMRP